MADQKHEDWSRLLADKVVFLAGGAGQLARHIAQACFAHGARLVLGDLDPVATNKVKDELVGTENKEDRVLVVPLDVRDEASIEQAIKLTLDKWKTIDVLLNTPAIFIFGNIEQVSAEDWSRVFEVNVRGYALLAKHVAPILKKQGGGSIVNIASTLGLIAVPNAVPYSATKGAILQMTRNLALDLGSFNIRVNSISPGLIDVHTIDESLEKIGQTMTDVSKNVVENSCLKRLVHPQQIANLVVFLSSDLCQFMTGANLVADCGHSII